MAMKKITVILIGSLLLLTEGKAGEYSFDAEGNISIRGTGREIGELLQGIPDTLTGIDILNTDSSYIADLGAWLARQKSIVNIALNRCHPAQVMTVLDSIHEPREVRYLVLQNMNLGVLPSAVKLFVNLKWLTITSCEIHPLPSWLFELPMLESIHYEYEGPGKPIRDVHVNTALDFFATSNEGLYRDFGEYADSLYQATGIQLNAYKRSVKNNLGHRSKAELSMQTSVKEHISIKDSEVLLFLSRVITDARERPQAFEVSPEQAAILRRTDYVNKVLHIEGYGSYFVLEGVVKIKGLLAKRLQVLIHGAG